MRLASARRSSSKMASEGASGEAPGQSLGQPLSVGQSLSTAVLSSADTKCELNMDNLSKPELLTLLSVMEGELEARDLVIEALRAQRKEVFLQERYGHYSLRDPFLALQRDLQCSVSGDKDSRIPGSSPMAVLQAVMAHCRKMQERMSAQLAAAQTRHKRLEMEKLQLQSLEQEHRKLTAQIKDERDKNKHIVMMLVRECKQLATRVVEESQRFDELQTRYDEETRNSTHLQEELDAEKQKSQQMEAKMEKQLSELDTEREQLRAKLTREEAESQNLRQQVETLRTGPGDATEAKANESVSQTEGGKVLKASVSVATDPVASRTISCQTDSDTEGPKKSPLSIPVKPSPSNYVGLSLPKSRTLSSENGSESAAHVGGLPSGVSPRVQAARYKFQEQDQNQNGSQGSPPARDLSPTNRETNFAAKQQARHTVTQVLSRFTSPPSSTPLRPGLPHSASESGPFPGRLSHPIGIKSPTVARIDRGNPPPIPPKKPGLSQTPAPSVKAGEGGRAGLKPVTPQLPPKPALDLVPALAASQTKMASAACAIPPPSPSISLEATASGGRSPIEPGPGGAGSGALDSDPLLLPAAAVQEHATLLSMLLHHRPRNRSDLPELRLPEFPSPTDPDCEPSSSDHGPPLGLPSNHTDDWDSIEELRICALFAAAQDGNIDDLQLLLSAVDANVSDSEGFTPLHFAAAHGYSSCVSELLSSGARVDAVSSGGHSALFVASESEQTHCVKVLLDFGADRNISTTDGCSPLHAAVLSGNLALLRLLLYHAPPPVATAPPAVDTETLTLSSELLNQTNSDGWTAAHIAAAHGHKECLEELCSHHEQDLKILDKWNRTIHDLATDDCKDLLENLNSYRVHVEVRCSGAPVGSIPVWTSDHVDLGSLEIDQSMAWSQLWSGVVQIFMDYARSLCESPDQDQNQVLEKPLGLSCSSIKSISVGGVVWSVGDESSVFPWDLVRKPLSPSIQVHLRDLSESRLDEVALFSLIPLSSLNNYVRLVEQYGNLMLHGVEGSLQEDLAAVVARCIQRKQEVSGLCCDVVRIQVEPDLTRDQLLESLTQAGLLVPVGSEGGASVVVTLEHLERASSLSALMGDLCPALDQRGPQHLVHTPTGPHWLLEGGYIITTLSKPRLQGSELRLQQHLRWISLRWDQEPLSGLLARTLRARLQASGGSCDGPAWRSALWVTRSWQRLNSSLCRLGTPEALLGPEPFMSGPLSGTEDSARFLSDLWNSVVVPRVEAAIVSRVSPRRCPLAPSGVPGRAAGQSVGQKALVKAALGIVLNRAVLQDCPLSRAELQRVLPLFSGSSSSPIQPSLEPDPGPGLKSGLKPGSVSPRVRRRRDHRLRRSNTTPRKRAVSGAGLGGAGGSFKDGSQSTSDVRFFDGELHRAGGLTLFSDEETDLILELQNMCSSKSEPDISLISQTKEGVSLEHGSQQQPPTTPVSPSISRSRLPLRSPRAATSRPDTTYTTTTTATTVTASTATRTCPDDNQHFVNNNLIRSSEDAVWILHENYITHNAPLLPR